MVLGKPIRKFFNSLWLSMQTYERRDLNFSTGSRRCICGMDYRGIERQDSCDCGWSWENTAVESCIPVFEISCLICQVWRINELMDVKWLAECLTQTKCSITISCFGRQGKERKPWCFWVLVLSTSSWVKGLRRMSII